MDDDTLSINTGSKNEKIKNFFIKNKKKIIVFISILIFFSLGYFVFQEIKKKNKAELGNKYNLYILNFLSGNKNNIENKFVEIIEAKDSTYSPLALYFLIDNNILKTKKKTNKFFDILINDTKLAKEVKNLIIYKKALYNSDTETENNLLKMLNPIINSESIWKSHSLYLMGEYFFNKNEKQKAKQFYEQIMELDNANDEIKVEAKKRIQSELRN